MIVSTLLFFYAFETQVISRYDDLIQRYNDWKMKRQMVLNPQQGATRKMNLLTRKNFLLANLVKDTALFEQSRTGVFEFLNATAKRSGIQFELLAPLEAQLGGGTESMSFKVNFHGRYHRVASFINGIESGPISVRLRKIEMISQSASSSLLQVNIEGTSYLLPRKYLR